MKHSHSSVARITRDDLFEIFEMRRLLEGEAAFGAAERIDRVTMQRLEQALDALDDRTPHEALLQDDPRRMTSSIRPSP